MMTNMMRARWIAGWVVVLMLVAAIGYAQQPPAAAAPAAAAAPQAPARTLSLAEALDIARHNNPDYLSTLNDRWPASARQRSAVLNLLTPTASVSAGSRHTAEGTSFVTGIPTPFTSPANTGTSWGLNLGYALSGTTLANRGLTAADARAADADIAGAARILESSVRSQYLQVLQSQAQSQLAHRSLERATENLNLARARYAVGQGTLIDVRRAEVDNGQAEVTLLKADQDVENQILVLFNRLGIPAPEPLRAQLTDTFPVTAPPWTQQQLIDLALAENPVLQAVRAREASARWSTRAAYSQYMPSLGFSGSYGGYRQSFDSNTTSHTPPTSNSGTSPLTLSVFISMPLYDGFSRASQIQQARAPENDLSLAIRARELLVRSDVTAAYHALVAAYRVIELQRANKAAAAEALDLGTQRYRVGSGSYLELLDARLAADKADADYVGAVYDYHKAIATLETAVGRPLR